jgi:phosphomannomutase
VKREIAPIFKAYDIRGTYPDQLEEGLAERIGLATSIFLAAGRVAVGHDVRNSAPSIAEAVTRGILRAGADVLNLGHCTTPMLYYAVGRYKLSGGIMVTASHNPPEWIGLKICRQEAIPIGRSSGLDQIQALVSEGRVKGNKQGKIESVNISGEYRDHILGFLQLSRRLRIAVDTANGSVGPIFQAVFSGLPLDIFGLYFEPNGSFPNHEPNPLKEENTRELCRVVRQQGADLGVAFDGDGDRCIFVDERGERIPADRITVLLAREVLPGNPAQAVVYDLRSSRVVREEIQRLGGRPIRERVGHAFIKQTMRAHSAIVGGELSGHYYFRDHFFADSGLVAFAMVITYLSKLDKGLSQDLVYLDRYFATGEINFRVQDVDLIYSKIQRRFSDGRIDYLDGLTVEYPDWWFNVRPSNTEPLVRLNLEACTQSKLKEAKAKLFEILGTPV